MASLGPKDHIAVAEILVIEGEEEGTAECETAVYAMICEVSGVYDCYAVCKSTDSSAFESDCAEPDAKRRWCGTNVCMDVSHDEV